MKVVDEERMLLNGQAQGSSGLIRNLINAEVEVREQSALDIAESVLLPSSFLLHITISHIFCFSSFISLIRMKSLP